jgi:cell division septal protein FtsQ
MSPQNKETLSRSDLVRQRRQQSSQQRVKTAATKVTRAPVQPRPAVTTRGAGKPIGQVNGKNVRRQVYYSLGAERAEVRMPAMPAINVGWRLVSGIMVVSLIAALIVLLTAPIFKISTFTLKGIKRVTTTDIESVAHLTGFSIFEVDVRKVSENINASFPELANMQVFISIPAIVTISATERTPILAWKNGDQTYWIDQDGVIMPARGDAGELLTVSANTEPPQTLYAIKHLDQPQGISTIQVSPDLTIKKLDTTILSSIFKLSTKLPAKTTLLFNDVNGLGWKDKNKFNVFLGFDLEDFDQKMVMYEAISKELKKEGVRPKMISVEFLNQPFFRTE